MGADVTGVQVGDRVAIEPGTPCRRCHECLAGRYHLCPDLEFFATPPYDGALVQRMAVDARNLYRLPDSMSYEQGALVEPLSVGIWGCKRAGLEPGDEVLVTGAGPVGLLAASVARAFGALSVTVTDVSEFRLGLAASMGFDTERADEPSGRTFEVLLECSGAPGALAAGLRRLRPAGRAAMIGMSKEDAIALPLAQLNPPGAHDQPGEPLQRHLAAGHRADRLRAGGRRPAGHAPLRAGPRPRRRWCWAATSPTP